MVYVHIIIFIIIIIIVIICRPGYAIFTSLISPTCLNNQSSCSTVSQGYIAQPITPVRCSLCTHIQALYLSFFSLSPFQLSPFCWGPDDLLFLSIFFFSESKYCHIKILWLHHKCYHLSIPHYGCQVVTVTSKRKSLPIWSPKITQKRCISRKHSSVFLSVSHVVLDNIFQEGIISVSAGDCIVRLE